MHKLTVRVSPKMRDAITVEAARLDISIAELIRRLVIREIPGAAAAVLVENVKLSGALWDELKECRRPKSGSPGGQKILAIRAVRNETGLGLLEAKAIVDSIWDTRLV